MSTEKLTNQEVARAEQGWDNTSDQRLSLIEALSIAQKSISELSSLPVDSIASSETREDGGWKIVIDVLEGSARIGENDLLASYQLEIGPDGALMGYSRIRRYRREEGGIAS